MIGLHLNRALYQMVHVSLFTEPCVKRLMKTAGIYSPQVQGGGGYRRKIPFFPRASRSLSRSELVYGQARYNSGFVQVI